MIAIQKNPQSRLSDSRVIKHLEDLVRKERETTPEIMCMLEKNELNLTGVCMLADIITPENKSGLLKEVRQKSKRRIEQIVAGFKPGKDIPEKVMPVFVSTFITQPEKTPEGENKTSGTHTPELRSVPDDSARNNSGKSTTAGGGRKLATGSRPLKQTQILKKKFKLEFAVDPECLKKIEEAKVLLSKKYPEGVPLGTLLEEALDAYLNKQSPERKKKRREKRKAKQQSKKKEKQPGHHTNTKRSRHIPQAVQDEVYARDKGCCTFVGPDGMRCNSTWNLEIDHIIPFAKGGANTISNLRLLCAKHYNFEAERVYGRQFIKRRMLESRSAKSLRR